MNTEENDPLWRLLGEAKPPAVSPFFARNVLREIRTSKQEAPRKAGVLAWFHLNGDFAWLAGSAAIVLACVGAHFFDKPVVAAKVEPKQEILVAQQLAKNPDSDVIKNLDELLASDDNSVWLDNSAN